MEYDDTGCLEMYLVSIKKQNVIWYGWYFGLENSMNKKYKLPPFKKSTHQYTKNCALVFGLKQFLHKLRTQESQKTFHERYPIVVIHTDATYIQEGIQTYLPKWVRNDFCNSKGKKIKNSIFWKGLHHELIELENLDVFVKIIFSNKDRFIQKAYQFTNS